MLRMTIFRSKVSLSFVLLGTAAVPLSAAVAQAAKDKPETYTVQAGETLFSIARKLYGDESYWSQLYQLNKASIPDPKVIHTGQVLKLVPKGGAAKAEGPAQAPAPKTVAKAEPRAEKPAAPKAEVKPEPAKSVAVKPAPKPEVAKPTAEKPKAEAEPARTMRPEPQPERKPVVTEPEDQVQEPAQSDSLFSKRRGVDAYTALRTYREQPYRPLRRGEFFSAGFLTEGDKLPFGHLFGAVTPQQIRNLSDRATATIYTEVAVTPPEGAQYRPNDSLLVVQVFDGPEGYGDIVVPTGMVRITGVSGNQTIGSVVAVYGAIRNGQMVLPAEKFVDGGTARARAVEKGVTGIVLGQRETRELKHPQDYLFINLGKKDGVARGDIFEVRRDAKPRPEAAATVDERMAVLQVVHVRERSATVKIIGVTSPDIPPGTRVRQISKLPS